MLLFFLSWELELLPVYLLLAIWGGKNRQYAATKFIIYTAGSSIFILLAALAMGFYGTGVPNFEFSHLANQNFGQGFPNKHNSANTTQKPYPDSPYIEIDGYFQLPTNVNEHWGRGRNRVVYDSDTGAVFFTSDHYNTSHFLGCLDSKKCNKSKVDASKGNANCVINDDILQIGKSLGLTH